MDPLLIKEEILQVIASNILTAKDHFTKCKIDSKVIEEALGKKKRTENITVKELAHNLAYLMMEDDISLSADDHTRKPMYVAIKEKGISAATSHYFKEKYLEKKKDNWKFYAQIGSQIVLGSIGLIAFVLTTSKSCTGTTSSQSKSNSITPTHKAVEMVKDSARPTTNDSNSQR